MSRQHFFVINYCILKIPRCWACSRAPQSRQQFFIYYSFRTFVRPTSTSIFWINMLLELIIIICSLTNHYNPCYFQRHLRFHYIWGLILHNEVKRFFSNFKINNMILYKYLKMSYNRLYKYDYKFFWFFNFN